MATKRKWTVLSIKDKQIIISRLDKGEKGTNLAQEFGISKQQISDIRKNKDKILKFTDSIETSEGLNRKSLKLADDEQLDKALYTWFIQQRSSGTPISGLLLQEKAKHFSTRCLKHVNMDALPVIYKSQKNAWMNSEIFA